MNSLSNIEDREIVYNKWSRLIEAGGDITDDTMKLSTAIVLENAQRNVDYNAKKGGRSLLTEAADITAGPGGVFGQQTNGGMMGPDAQTDARVPNIVIPMIRRIYPQLIAHKLVGVQPMQAPIGMCFAFRAKYGRNQRNGDDLQDKSQNPSGYPVEIGFNDVDATHSGVTQNPARPTDPMFNYFLGASGVGPFGQQNFNRLGEGAELGDSENWAVGSSMAGAGFEILKTTVTAKTRKLGTQISRETEEDMKAMQGLNATQEISDILSYEIAQEIDRQLLAEIVKSAIATQSVCEWDPAEADARHQTERVNSLYTTILNKSSEIAVRSRRGAANFCVGSPTATALLESQIYNPLSVGAKGAFGKEINNGLGITEVGSLRDGTITLYRDTLAGGDYVLLGFKGANVYDAGVFYLPYIPLELINAVDPMTFNPTIGTRTRYGVTTNLFGAGYFYQFIGLKNLDATFTGADGVTRKFIQK